MLTLHWIVFNADTESYPVYSMNSNGRELEQVVHTLRKDQAEVIGPKGLIL